MAAMDMEDDDDIWAHTASSPSASPPQPVSTCAGAGGFISTQLSLNSRLHLLSSSAAAAAPPGAASPPHFAADSARHHHHHHNMGLAASPPPFFSSYGLDGAPAARTALEDEMCVGAAPSAAAWAGGADRRKKRMIKNRESAARSRARKQAYVRELEREVQLLQQENESLRVKYEQLRVSVEVPMPVKKTLQRMPSAPF